MSEHIDFHLSLHGKGEGKKLIVNHDSGQGSSELLLTLGAESAVFNPADLKVLFDQAHALLQGPATEQQVRINTPIGQRMPPMPMQGPMRSPQMGNVQAMAPRPYDRDDK